MPEIITDGPVPQIPIGAAEDTYSRRTDPGLGAFALGTLQEAGTAYLGRAAERGTVAGSSSFDQGLAALAAQGGAFDQPLIPAPEPVQSPEMAPEQYNDLYAPRDLAGKIQPIGDKPMPEALARIIGKQKADAMQRESVLSRFAETHWGPTTFAAGAIASMLDPLNAGTLFLPMIGEGALATQLGGGILGRTAARIGAGAATGAAVQAPFSALKMGLSPEEAGDYGWRAAMRDILYGAAGMAVLHAGVGTVGELLGRAAGHTPGTAEAAASDVLKADAPTTNAAMRSAVGEIAEGRPVDVAPIVDAATNQSPPGIAVYHGSPNAFENFDLSQAGTATDEGLLGRAVYFSTDRQVGRSSPNVYEARADLKNPLQLTMPKWGADKKALVTEALGIPKSSSAAEITAAAQARGFDGVILDYSALNYHHQEVAVFDPKQISRPQNLGPGDWLKEAADRQAEIQRNGFAPGVSQDVGELLGRAAGHAPATAEAAAADVLRTDAPTTNAAMRSAIGEIADGRPVDVEPVVAAGEAPKVATPRSVVALRAPDGSIIAGKPGEIHADLLDRYDAAHSPGTAEPGFIGADGRFKGEFEPVGAPEFGPAAGNLEGRALREAQALRRQGWAPGVSQDELAASTDAVYGHAEAAGERSGEPPPEPAARPEAGTAAATEGAAASPELAAAEQKLAQIAPEHLLPEDQAELARTAEQVETASTTLHDAFQKAAACLMGLV